MSLPSTVTPSIPAPLAFSDSKPAAHCSERGTEIAHWLLFTTKTKGKFQTPAQLMDSRKSPFDVAPSPQVTTAAL